MHNVPTIISEMSIKIANLINTSDAFVETAEYFRFKLMYMAIGFGLLVALWLIQYIWRVNEKG